MTNQITPAKQTTGCAGLVLECKLVLKLVHRNKSSFIRRTCGSLDLFCPWVGLCKSFRKLMLKVICRKLLVGNSPSLQMFEDETWVARVACVRRGGKGERRAREAREDRGRGRQPYLLFAAVILAFLPPFLRPATQGKTLSTEATTSTNWPCLECVHCHAVKNKSQNHAVDKVKKLWYLYIDDRQLCKF